MKSLSDWKESLDRYRKYYPENCVGRDDIEILLFRKVINENEAFRLRYGRSPEDGAKPPKLKRKPVEPAEKKPKPERARLMTTKQFEKACDIKRDNLRMAIDMGFDDGNIDGALASMAIDTAESLLAFPGPTNEWSHYLSHHGVDPKYHAESLADNLV